MMFRWTGYATFMRAMCWAVLAAGLVVTALLSRPGSAAPIIVVGQGLIVTGTATQVGAVWEYRYRIEETAGLAATPVRFIVSESAAHAGLHHEFNFQNDGGVFSYDFMVPPMFAAISAHNYFWNNLAIAARGVITIGFDDEHGPTMATWGVQRFGAGAVFAGPADLLPVPAPEPVSLSLLGIGVAALGFALRRRGAASVVLRVR